MEILGRLGQIAMPAVNEAHRVFFGSPDPTLRLEAPLAANTIQRPTPEALPVLMQALKERATGTRNPSRSSAPWKTWVSTAPSPPPRTLTNTMMQSKENFSDPSAERPVLAQALSELDPRRSELVDLEFDLKQKKPALRYRAAYALSVMDPPPVGALEPLVGSLGDSDVTVVARILIALKRIGLEKTERLGVAAKIKAAETRVKAANIEGFDAAYSAPASK